MMGSLVVAAVYSVNADLLPYTHVLINLTCYHLPRQATSCSRPCIVQSIFSVASQMCFISISSHISSLQEGNCTSCPRDATGMLGVIAQSEGISPPTVVFFGRFTLLLWGQLKFAFSLTFPVTMVTCTNTGDSPD